MLTIAAGAASFGAWAGLSGMSVILLVLGILLAAAGGALIGFGLPIKELSLGGTLILAGAFAVVGGLLLIGLSAVVTELARVTAALKGSQLSAPTAPARAARIEVPAPPAEVVAREPVKEVVNVEPAPAPVPGPAVEVSASAIERLRSSIPRPDKAVPEAEEETVPLSPNGQHATHHAEPPPQVEPVPRSAGAAAVETREPRLDFLFRPRQVRQARRSSRRRSSRHNKRRRSTRSGPSVRRAKASPILGSKWLARPQRPPQRTRRPSPRSLRRQRRNSAASRSSSRAWSTVWPTRSTPTVRSRRSYRRERCASDRSPSCARTSRTTLSVARLTAPQVLERRCALEL